MNKRLFNTSLLAGLMASLGLGSSALAQASLAAKRLA